MNNIIRSMNFMLNNNDKIVVFGGLLVVFQKTKNKKAKKQYCVMVALLTVAS